MIVALVALCALLATRPAPTDHAAMTEQLAADLMRQAATLHEETLTKFKVVAIDGDYVRAVVNVPEEFTGDMPVDIEYEYGWHLQAIRPVRGESPGPG